MTVQGLFQPHLPQGDAHRGTAVLRDGTAASLRPADASDAAAVRALVDRVASMDSSARSILVPADPRSPEAGPGRLTLVVERGADIVAAGGYAECAPGTAEIAFVVDPDFQGKGLATLLLERLAIVAARAGYERFEADVDAENGRMLGVLADSGFTLRTRPEASRIVVQLSLEPNEASVALSELRDRVSTVASLRPFFRPSSVALVGASREPTSVGGRLLRGLISAGFTGSIWPCNPHASELSGLPVFRSVSDLPGRPDLVVIAVPAAAVERVVDECGRAGARSVVVISAGFAETGPEGARLQESLVERVRGHGMRMIGPNCLGILCTDPTVRLNASFSPSWPPAGTVAMASQSGALGLALLALARERGLGVSSFVSLGNKADVSSNDLIQYWEEDERTSVVLLYLESFGNPRRFAQLARRVGRRKPIVVVKSGRSTSGIKAASSHTAALAASDVTVDALFHQTGVLRVDTLDEMFQVASALSSQPTPAGRNVAIVTNAGGPGILAADACEARGLAVPALGSALQSQIAGGLPAAASATNPVDMIASAGPDEYRRTLLAVLADDGIDAAIVIHVPAGIVPPESISDAIAEVVTARRGAAPKPVLACMMPGEDFTATPISAGTEIVPTYPFPEQAAGALAAMADYRAWQETPAGTVPDLDGINAEAARTVCAQALAARGDGWLAPDECSSMLEAFGVQQVPTVSAPDAAAAVRAAAEIGYPVALKLASTRVLHKTDVGGVMLGLADASAVETAFNAIAAAVPAEDFAGVVVQRMVSDATEILVGASVDPLFGPILAFGLGGIHVEILRDVVFRVGPLTDRDTAEMVRAIRGFALLEGYRGHPAADVGAIEDVLLRISRLVQEVPAVAEMDLNPVFALQVGCLVADSRIRVTSGAA